MLSMSLVLEIRERVVSFTGDRFDFALNDGRHVYCFRGDDALADMRQAMASSTNPTIGSQEIVVGTYCFVI